MTEPAAGGEGGGAPAPAATARADDTTTAALWLETLERLAARASHPVRNALNGAALNAEVVRSRAGRDGPAAPLLPFATAAAGQLDHAVAGISALLAFLRPEPAPADAAGIAGRVASLLREPTGARAVLELDAPTPAFVAGPPGIARLVIVRTLLDCVPPGAHAQCVIRDDDAIFLTVQGDAVLDSPWDAPLSGLTLASGITRTAAGSGITVRLPRAASVRGAR